MGWKNNGTLRDLVLKWNIKASARVSVIEAESVAACRKKARVGVE